MQSVHLTVAASTANLDIKIVNIFCAEFFNMSNNGILGAKMCLKLIRLLQIRRLLDSVKCNGVMYLKKLLSLLTYSSYRTHV